MNLNPNDVVYGDNLSHFTEIDYLDLAIASLDQVGAEGITKVISSLQSIRDKIAIYSTMLEPEGHR